MRMGYLYLYAQSVPEHRKKRSAPTEPTDPERAVPKKGVFVGSCDACGKRMLPRHAVQLHDEEEGDRFIVCVDCDITSRLLGVSDFSIKLS
jgi:hypothetical protein